MTVNCRVGAKVFIDFLKRLLHNSERTIFLIVDGHPFKEEYAAHQSKKPAVFDPDRAKIILQFLVNTCHVWREDATFVEKFKTMLNMK